MSAAMNGHPSVLRLLLDRGAAMDATVPKTGGTAFHYACANNNPDCAEALARAGCGVQLETKGGLTGCQLAEEKGHTAVVRRSATRAVARILDNISGYPIP
jgi:ankyrin repeat protein